MTQTYTREEIGRRGDALYETKIRPLIETEENIGKMVSIDIESADFEVDTVGLAAANRLLARRPKAILYGVRIGFDAVYSLGDGPLERSKN